MLFSKGDRQTNAIEIVYLELFQCKKLNHRQTKKQNRTQTECTALQRVN